LSPKVSVRCRCELPVTPQTLSLGGAPDSWTAAGLVAIPTDESLRAVTCPDALIVHVDCTIAGCTLDEEEGCRGSERRHEVAPSAATSGPATTEPALTAPSSFPQLSVGAPTCAGRA
jgi:hypothetical protein